MFFRSVVVIATMCALFPSPGNAHPLHNSYSQVTVDPATRTVTVSIRAFIDDFSRHISGAPGGRPGGSLEKRAATYLASAFQLTEASGKPVALQWCGWTKVGDQFAMCLRGAVQGNGAGWKIRNAVLMDLFPDQLNVARVTLGKRTANLLFRPATTTQMIPAR